MNAESPNNLNEPGAEDPETYAIIGAAMEVHTILGSGFLEHVYHEALKQELRLRAIPFRSEVELPVVYKGRPLAASYRADLICFDSIIVEMKALARLTSSEESQLLNYLKAAGTRRGLLLNFGSSKLQFWRRVMD